VREAGFEGVRSGDLRPLMRYAHGAKLAEVSGGSQLLLTGVFASGDLI
jgi:hypothetical protein